MSRPPRLTAGLLAGTGAGLVWGLAFLVPVLLPGWSAVAVTAGRYLAYGMVSVALLAREGRPAWRLAREHWRAALAFAVTGNVGYYLLLVIGIQKIGAPVTDTIIGSIPVAIAVASNWRTPALPWRRLAVPVALSLAGLALVNAAAFAGTHPAAAAPLGTRLLGLAAAVGAVALWTWYGLANATFLATRPAIPAASWSSVVGLATLVVTLATLLPATLLSQTSGPAVSHRDTVVFLTGIAVLGVAVSWGGTWLWNTASARLPVTTAGILINIETVSGYVYVYAARQHWPPLGQILGFALILAGVGLALTRRQAPTHPPRQAGDPHEHAPQCLRSVTTAVGLTAATDSPDDHHVHADVGSSGTPNRSVEEHRESIRAFLAMIDPDTGYIGDCQGACNPAEPLPGTDTGMSASSNWHYCSVVAGAQRCSVSGESGR
jgi:drug/metabolite transporter (DMT)-like permease